MRPVEINLIQKVFETKGQAGWVLDFTNRTFKEFFDLELQIDIYSPLYADDGDSKGKRLRCFFRKVDNAHALRALRSLWAYRQELPEGSVEDLPNCAEQIAAIISKLEAGGPTEPRNIARPETLDMIDFASFADRLYQMKDKQPHQRGREFEAFLIELFTTFGMKGAKSFRNTGEEIDGSFELDHEIYLLEAKWWSKSVGAAELHVLAGKVQNMATWTRGLFVSFEGFTDVGLEAFGKGKPIVLMEGREVYLALQKQIRIDDLIRAKVRAAAHTGNPFTPIKRLGLGNFD
nr:restriction endonuclease [Novosphingobium profundi]